MSDRLSVGSQSLLPPEFWQSVQQFNQQAFYECHDTLEALWMEAVEPEKRFYQGVLQIAVACHHLGNHNYRGAVMLLGEGIRRLTDYTPADYGVDVTKLVEQSAILLQALQMEALQLTALESSDLEKISDFGDLASSAPKSRVKPILTLPQISILKC